MQRGAGFTLIEVIITSVILTVVLGMAMMLFIGSNVTVGESLRMADSNLSANRVEALLKTELRDAANFAHGSGDLPKTGYNGGFGNLAYTRAGAFVMPAGTLTFGPPRELRFVAEEALDTVDNDNDTLIDEGRIDLFENGNYKVTLARFISGEDYGVAVGNNLVTIQFTVMRRSVEEKGKILTAKRSIALAQRN